jgi:hypothetical protein
VTKHSRNFISAGWGVASYEAADAETISDLTFKNIKIEIFDVVDWNYAAYFKVRDQEVGGSNPLAPPNF